MSGHNKWSKIKHKKAASDAQKSKGFSKLSRLLTSEVKKSGGDKSSPSVRAIIEKARSINMPKDNIEKALSKGSEQGGESFESVIYEAYGPGGSAIIIDALTDNRNRTAAEVKHILSAERSSLAEPGSASWAFRQEGGEWKPNATIPLPENEKTNLEKLIEILKDNDDVQNVYTNAEGF